VDGEQAQLRAPGSAADEPSSHPEPETSELVPVADPAPAWSSWSNLWQLPVIAASFVLIVIGVRTTIHPASANDFGGVFQQIDQLISASQFETARSLLRDMVEPNLGEATQAERARFHATVADLLYCAQRADGLVTAAGNQRIAEQYAQAVKLELTLSLTRIERLTVTLLDLGDLAGARTQLSHLDALVASQSPEQPQSDDVLATRNRVFRRLVDATLRQSDAAPEDIAQMIGDYRSAGELAAEDEVWSIARLAELRLASGKAADVVQMLLIEMRRLEGRGLDQQASNFGELYVLLGRAYFDIGDLDRSKSHVDMAMRLLAGSEPAFGEALVVAGRIAQSQDDATVALEQFNVVVRDYLGTPSYAAGLLGRAETQSVLGDHEASQVDYAELRQVLRGPAPDREITPLLVAQSLCDRHDAAIALGKFDRALAYANLAETFFDSEETPLEVLIRLASTHRQLGANTLSDVARPEDDASGESHAVSPATPVAADALAIANEHYQQAAEFYLRHANSRDAARLDDRQWATSLWLAADSFDRAGRLDHAVRYFLRYLDSGSIDDPRRAESLFRVGQACQAQMNYEDAIGFYEQLVADHARSSYAADSHVPLARCYLAMDRRPEAEQQLREVLSGARLLTPEAQDYRDALIELGTLHYSHDEYAPAIERFTEAMERYPHDPHRLEVVYRLADSYRASALQIADRLKEPPPLPPSEQGRLNALRAEQLQRALDLFGDLCDRYSPESLSAGVAAPGGGEGSLQQDLLRRAHLYRADCAFHLGYWDLAVEGYDRSARLYSTHASSMYALVQIVNCYNLLNDPERAGAAHRRALVRLKQLPDGSFDSPESLMDRAAWERWLESSPVGGSLAAAGSSG